MQKLSYLLIVLLILIFLPYFIGLNISDVKDKDEAIYAEVAREMVESGNYLNPTFNYRPWFQHPPLTMWLIALSYRVWGVTPFAVRFPSILLALLSTILVYSLGRDFTSSTGGLLSSLCLVSSPAYHLMVRDAKLDMVLLFFITLAFYAYNKAIKKKIYLVLFYLSLGLAFLTKGPVGIIFPFVPISLHWYMKRKEITLPKISLIWGISLTLFIIVPWYYYMYRTQGTFFLKRIILEQNLGRFFTTHYTEPSSPFYYFHTFAWAFLPFLFPFLASLRSAFLNFKESKFLDDGYIIPLLWFFIPFILMSFSRSKLPQYIFPVLPPASLLTGGYLWKVIKKGNISSLLLAFQFLSLVFFLTLFLSLNLIFFPILASFSFWFTLFFFFSLFITALVALRLKSAILLISLIAITMSILHFSINFHVDPSLLRYQPSRYLAMKLQNLVPDASFVYTYKFSPKPSLVFYCRKKVVKLSGKELEDLLNTSEGLIIIFPEEEMRNLKMKGYSVKPLAIKSYYPVSRLSLEFLDLRRREDVCKDIILGEIRPRGG